MRIKSLSIVASFLVFSLAITSCLDSDNDYELSSDNLITAFSLDTIYGETYKFTIDQINGLIYNVDSVPYSADTIINKILIKTFTSNGYATSGTDFAEPFSQDTIFNYTDSIDFMKHNPLRLRLRSADGLHIKQYTIEVRIHETDPDTLVWGNDPKENDDAYIPAFTGGKITTATESKAVLLGDDILVFASDGNRTTVYPQTSQWAETVITTTPTNIHIQVSSIQSFNGKLYALGDPIPNTIGGRRLYQSVDGMTWDAALGALTNNDFWGNTLIPENLITTFSGKDSNGNSIESLAAILLNGTRVDDSYEGPREVIQIDAYKYVIDTVFATATILPSGILLWDTKGTVVPSNFPTKHIVATKSFTTPTGGQQALLIGEPVDSEATATTPWFSNDGLNWGDMTPSKTKYALPVMSEPSILYYGNTIYAFGNAKDDGFSYIYTSINGVVWEKIEKKFMFPFNGTTSAFKDRTGGYAMAVDNDNYLWMFWNQKDDAWRGKLNRLGFLIQ